MSIIKEIAQYHPEVIPSYRKAVKVVESCQSIDQFNTARRYVALFLTSIQSSYNQPIRRSRVIASIYVVHGLKIKLDQLMRAKERTLR
jgi:hypothetical protein